MSDHLYINGNNTKPKTIVMIPEIGTKIINIIGMQFIIGIMHLQKTAENTKGKNSSAICIARKFTFFLKSPDFLNRIKNAIESIKDRTKIAM